MPGLVVSPAGTLFAYTEARYEDRTGGSNGHGDYCDIDIALRRSKDGGATWDEPRAIVKHKDFGPGPCHNFCAIADRDLKCVHALFSHDYARVYYLRSDDDGETWSTPREITDVYEPIRKRFYWTTLSSGLGHGVQLRNGRLVVAVWFGDGPRPSHGPTRSALLHSDDHGQTWKAGDLIQDNIACCNEAEAIELSDGRVLVNMRSGAPENRRVAVTSPDGKGNWSVPRLDWALTDPQCHGGIIRYSSRRDSDGGSGGSGGSGGRDRILFSHPDSLDDCGAGAAKARQNVTVHLSYDECETWPVSRVIEPGYSGYSDLAVLPDKTVAIIYETGWFPSGWCPHHLTLARFSMDWLTKGEDRG